MTEHVRWRKSSLSASNGECVEVAFLAGAVLIRDSKLGDDSPILEFTPAEWDAFIGGAVRGEFSGVAAV